MSAYAGVLEHPYFAVTSPGGQFELKNLPAGDLHDRSLAREARHADAAVTLGEKDSKDVSFTFKALCRDTTADRVRMEACERPQR